MAPQGFAVLAQLDDDEDGDGGAEEAKVSVVDNSLATGMVEQPQQQQEEQEWHEPILNEAWMMPIDERLRLYKDWEQHFKRHERQEIERLIFKYNEKSRHFKNLRVCLFII